MDFFGIGQAVNSMMLIYKISSRATGRTTSLIESLKDGDRVIFTNSNEANRVKQLAADAGAKIETLVLDPKDIDKIFQHGTSQGRTIFDHTWVEQYYLNAIEYIQKDIDHLQRETSGYGEAHRETRRKAEEIAKWTI